MFAFAHSKPFCISDSLFSPVIDVNTPPGTRKARAFSQEREAGDTLVTKVCQSSDTMKEK